MKVNVIKWSKYNKAGVTSFFGSIILNIKVGVAYVTGFIEHHKEIQP